MVDTRRRFAAEIAIENLLLDLLHLLLDGADDGQVLVDDEVHQGIEDICRPLGQHVRRRFASRPQPDVRHQRSVADSDDVVGAEEHVRLAEVEVLPVGHLRRTQHDEERVFVLLDFRPLMRLVGVFDGQVVQAELLLDAAEQCLVRLVEAEPDEAIVLLQHVLDAFDRHFLDAQPSRVGGAGDHTALRLGRHRVHHLVV
jgi:hypothetical protein